MNGFKRKSLQTSEECRTKCTLWEIEPHRHIGHIINHRVHKERAQMLRRILCVLCVNLSVLCGKKKRSMCSMCLCGELFSKPPPAYPPTTAADINQNKFLFSR